MSYIQSTPNDPFAPRVIQVKPSNSIDATGNVIRRTQVTYMVGTHGPFSVTTPTETFKAEDVFAKMKAFAAEVAQLPGAGDGPTPGV